MTSRQVQNFLKEVSPSPGYILNYTKQQLSDLVYDTTGLELEDYEQNGASNSKRLSTLLQSVEPDISYKITEAILKHKETM